MAVSLTGIRPTGIPHLGNYPGMFRPALRLARDHEALCLVDLHARAGDGRGHVAAGVRGIQGGAQPRSRLQGGGRREP